MGKGLFELKKALRRGYMGKIILFDGDCNFCNQIVHFIIKRDPKGCFRFASLQSSSGKEWLGKYHIPENINSLVFLDGDHCYIKSTAALRIFKDLSGAWKLLSFFLIVPQPIRDSIYMVISKYRYKLFGKKDRCQLPTEEERQRFL
jgi:predicted DCC family thiol-disulfide oxidoreductase YuxK